MALGVMACIFDQLDKVWFNPDRMKAFWVKFDIAVIVKPFDLVPVPNHTLEKYLRAQLVRKTRRVFPWPVSNHFDCIANVQLVLCHTHENVAASTQNQALCDCSSQISKGNKRFAPAWRIKTDPPTLQ